MLTSVVGIAELGRFNGTEVDSEIAASLGKEGNSKGIDCRAAPSVGDATSRPMVANSGRPVGTVWARVTPGEQKNQNHTIHANVRRNR